MIFLRATAADDNPNASATVAFVDIPVPVGVKDGDLVLVAISLGAANVSITAPGPEWQLVTRTDPGRSVNVAVYWATSLNAPTRWSFKLSSAAAAAGVALVYGGADSFEPIEAFALSSRDESAGQPVAAITTSVDGEELAAFFVAGGSGSYTSPPSGYLTAVQRSQPNATAGAFRKQMAFAGTQVGSSALFGGGAVKSASIVVALRPSVGTLTVDDVRRRILDGLPAGADLTYDLNPSGDYFKYFQALAATLKVFAFDVVDLLRLEIVPQFSRYFLPKWERIFGLATSKTAKRGTVPQRQSQVVGAWRAAAGQGSSIPVVQATIAPLLGYVNASDLVVVEASRAALTAAHTYSIATDVPLPTGPTTVTLEVRDDARVAQMGAQAFLYIADTNSHGVDLTAPDGTLIHTTIVGAGASNPVLACFPGFAGRSIAGIWRLTVYNGVIGSTLKAGSGVFVEGVGRDSTGWDGRGAQIFHWVVYADPAKVGQNGTPPDYAAARAAVAKLHLSHTKGLLVTNASAYPSTTRYPPFLPRNH